jgi:hypothetical protein
MDIQWDGCVRDLVAAVASSDARTTYVDAKTGATIRINLNGNEDGKGEPFYIESPDGENLYDAYDRKEAVMILSNIRKGAKLPDLPLDRTFNVGKAKRKYVKKSSVSLGGVK